MRGSWLSDDDISPEPFKSKYSLSPVPDADFDFDDTRPGAPLDAPSDPLKSKPRISSGHALAHLNDTTPPWAGFLIVVGFLATLGVIVAAFATGNSETQTAAAVLVVLALIGLPALKRVSKDTHHGEYLILVAAMSAKIVATLLRYWAAFSGALYSRSDALTYHDDGKRIATDFISKGHLPNYKSFVGTNFVRTLTGILYAVIPPSKLAAFFVFAAFSFAGYVMFWRAGRRVLGPNDDRKYMYMVLFMPSLLYWPSSLGKEAVVIFGLGLASLGFARTITDASLSGGVLIAAGLMLVTYVRPHIALVLVIAVGVASLVRKRQGRQFASSLITLALLIPVGGVVLSQANSLFKTDITSQSGRDESLAATQKRTAQGGSQFDNQPVSISNPVQFPYATMTVILRPFPWESPSIQEFATAIEAAFIGYLLIKGFPRILRNLRRDNPYAIFSMVNLVVFIVLFSNFNNFGILARQRTQVAPFLYFLLALPEVRSLRSSSKKKAATEWERAQPVPNL